MMATTHKVLVTGFERFGKNDLNISQQILSLLPDRLGKFEIVKVCLPVSFHGAPSLLREAICTHRPHFVLMLGQGAAGSKLRMERFAHNLMDARQPDNDGYSPDEETIHEDAPLCLQTGINIKEIQRQTEGQGIALNISTSAGLYVCNRTYFEALLLTKKSLFVHIPKESSVEDGQSAVLEILKSLGAVVSVVSVVSDVNYR